jgi:alpha-2-macroglobulin
MKSRIVFRLLSLCLGAGVCVALLAASVTEEIRLGNLRGTVTMKENGKRLENAWVTLHYIGGGAEATKKYRRYQTEKDGTFQADRIPAGVYTIEASAKAHNLKRQSIVIEEGNTNTRDLVLEPKEPELELYASQRVFTPGDRASFQISGFHPATKATIHYYKLDLNQIVAKGGLSRLLYSFSRPGNEGGSDPSKSSTTSDQLDKDLEKDVEGVFTQPIDLPLLSEGFYYVRCSVGQLSKATYLNISKIGLVTKTTGKDALCYVADLVDGKPIQAAAIQAPGTGGFKKIATTNANGLANIKVPAGADSKALLLASFGKSQAVVDFDNQSGDNSGANRIFMYSDRPIYRPGDTVQFKGIVRKLQGLSYGLPDGGTVGIEIRDTDETAIQSFTLPVSARGTFNGSFKSNVEDAPGVYSIHANYKGAEFTYYANLAAYRKPEYTVKVTPNKKYFVYGERASATVKAEYYFGGPVVGAKVDAYVTRSPHYYSDYESDYADEEGDYAGDEYYSREFAGEYSEQVEAVTNEKGEAVIEFDSKTEGDPEIPDYDLDFAVNASMSDASNKVFEGSGDVPVVRGDISAEVEVDRYIAEPGETVNAVVTALKQGSKEPVAGRDVTLLVGTEKWAGGSATFILKESLTAKTDDKGIARIPVTVKSEGSLILKSTVMDDGGRPVKSVDYLYVEGDSMFGQESAKFALTLDKKSYQVGDKCKVLVETDKVGGSALITVQAEKVLASYVVNLNKKSTVLTIPIPRSYAPNVWVSAVAIKNRQLLEAQSRLVVDVKDHDLNITVTPDRPDYKPGETANLTIKTTDGHGQPVAADLSVAVVDESIYAIKSDTTNIKRGFYPIRNDNVRTNHSFENIYLDGGDKAGGDIPVRSKFLDTAKWLPTVMTDASGNGRASIELPDNLTSWRATAIGVSQSTQVGMTHVNFRARKPLMVRLELPSFLVQQDTQLITAIVNNDTGQDQEVTVRLDAQGVDVVGETSHKITVPATRPQSITWEVRTPNAGEATISVSAQGAAGAQDAEERKLEIKPHGRLTVEAHSGEITNGESATFTVSANAYKDSGRLRLSISPSIGTSIYQSLDDLIAFPYGCTEQTMSRFLPTVVLASTLKQLNVRSDLEAKIPEIVANGFARLSRMQHSNGAWGWWENDDADPFMTAYVLDGLHRAKQAGFDSDKIDVSNTLEWANAALKVGKFTEYNQRDYLYLCYAISLYGAKAEVVDALKKIKPKGASQIALLAMTKAQLGDNAGRDQALADLHDLIQEEGQVARFEGERWDYGAERIAFPLLALTSIRPQDPLIPKLVRYLMMTKQGNSWNSTRDSSLALVALTQRLKFTKEMGQPNDIDVIVNGGAARRIHFEPADQLKAELTIDIPVKDLQPGENRVEFKQSAVGANCYYSGELRQIEMADKLLSVNGPNSLSIARSYHLLEPQRMENGNLELKASKRSIDEARSGDVIQVELLIGSAVDREFVMIEDPIPSGCRITEREYIGEYEEWTYLWSQLVIRDDRAAFFLRDLPKGFKKLTYTIRAEQIGLGHALPTSIANMYDPAQTASGAETLLKVTE